MRFSAIRAIFIVLINMSLPKRETEMSSTYDVVFLSGRGGRALGGLILAQWRLDSGNPGIYLFIYSSLLSLCNRLGYERPTPHIF
jgi:hypothetical protein